MGNRNATSLVISIWKATLKSYVKLSFTDIRSFAHVLRLIWRMIVGCKEMWLQCATGKIMSDTLLKLWKKYAPYPGLPEVSRCRTQRWVWRTRQSQITNLTSEGINRGFETQCWCHQSSKQTPQEGLMCPQPPSPPPKIKRGCKALPVFVGFTSLSWANSWTPLSVNWPSVSRLNYS